MIDGSIFNVGKNFPAILKEEAIRAQATIKKGA